MDGMAPAPDPAHGNASEAAERALATRAGKPDASGGTMKLTRKMVLSRAKASNLSGVRKLNCWGSHITDTLWLASSEGKELRELGVLSALWHTEQLGTSVDGQLQWVLIEVPSEISICQELTNVEVITFSANNISDLEPINQCRNLTELYLRRNSIGSLCQLFHLKKLPRLKILWLLENPCCGPDLHHYRMTVLRNLPNLQKLDNQMVTEEELSHALLEGEEIIAPPDKLDMDSSCQNSTTESSVTESTVENENELMKFSLEETNKIREQLGMKPVVPRDKFSSFIPREMDVNRKKRNNILSAILLLLEELDSEGLGIVHQTVGLKLQASQKKELHEDR